MSASIAQPIPMHRADCRLRFAEAADSRLKWLVWGFTGLGAILLARLAQIVIMGMISGAGVSAVPLVDRGDIVDRNGVPLARTIPVHSIRVVKRNLMQDPHVLARQLAAIFPDTSEAEFLRKMTTTLDDFIEPSATSRQRGEAAALYATYRRDNDVEDFAQGLHGLFPTISEERFQNRIYRARASVIRGRATPEQLNAVNQLAEIGFEYPEEPERLYPQGSLAAHVLGFISPGRGGAMGIERYFEGRLTGDATRGTPLALSIDARVQAALELELAYAVTNLEAQGGAGLILDVDTGEVLAMASLPTFDPNRVRFQTDEAQWNAVSFSTYELGSTFKPITVAAAMDAGVVTNLARRYDATKPLMIGGHAIRDSHSTHRWLNVPEALVHSSNIVTAQIADELGGERLRATFRNLEFDRRPQIELSERGLPMWSSPWGRATTMTAGFGHSVKVTPLHLASAYAALVNGGIWRPATLMKIDAGDAPAGRRVFSEATSARMRQLLRMIVASGTGKTADAPGYRVGGKTGSAERVIDGRYARNSVVATFAAAFPMDRPRYVVLTMIDRPPGNAFSQGQRTAAYTAAPVVRKVIQRVGPMLGIYPDDRHDVDISELEPLLWKPRAER